MKLQRTVRYNPALFNVVPFVNVLFLVLLFFALSSTFLLHPGVSVALPVSSFTLGPQRSPLILSIASSPSIGFYFEDRRVNLDELASRLDALSSRLGTLIVRADRNVPYDVVMQAANIGLERGFGVVLATTEAPK